MNSWKTKRSYANDPHKSIGEPESYESIYHEGVETGQVPGTWLLSYLAGTTIHPLLTIQCDIAVFDSRKAAIETAAEIDRLTGKTHHWRINSVFYGIYHSPQELLKLLEV